MRVSVASPERSHIVGNQNTERDRDKKPQADQQHGAERKNDRETGEPIQLPDDKSKAGQHEPQQPGSGQREAHGGQHQGGQQGGPQRPAAK